jgi:putative FmdB family regulatory protein
MQSMEVLAEKWLVLVPNYDFKCNTCGNTREQFIYHKDYEGYVVRCPTLDCNKPMERVYTVPGIKFNGPGFYSTGG